MVDKVKQRGPVDVPYPPHSRSVIRTCSQKNPSQPCHKDNKSPRLRGSLDPHELYRLLDRYKQAQDKDIERRLHRTKNSTQCSQIYHHVPQCAASDFISTATAEVHDEQSVHPLSRSLVRSMDFANIGRLLDPGTRYEPRYFERQDQGGKLMAVVAERNQFQRNKALQAAAMLDTTTKINRAPQRGFDEHFNLKGVSGTTRQPDLEGIDEDVADHGASKTKPRRVLRQPRDRHDWVQRDEACKETSNLISHLLLPMLKRTSLSVGRSNAAST